MGANRQTGRHKKEVRCDVGEGLEALLRSVGTIGFLQGGCWPGRIDR